jgi:hypothetical protein
MTKVLYKKNDWFTKIETVKQFKMTWRLEGK